MMKKGKRKLKKKRHAALKKKECRSSEGQQ